MPQKDHGRSWGKSVSVTFRVSPEESELINTAVKFSGLNKNRYITKKLLDMDVIVQASPKLYKALKTELDSILAELKRIESGSNIDDNLLKEIELITNTLYGLKGDGNHE